MGHFPDNPHDTAGGASAGTTGSPPPLPLDTRTAEPPVIVREGVPIWALLVISLSLAVLCGAAGWAAGFIAGTVADLDYDYIDLEDVSMTVESPESVSTGEAFAIVVTVTNDSDIAHTISTIDFYDSYLEYITIESASPAWTERVQEDDYVTLAFPQTIQPGASLTIKFNAVARDKPGTTADDLEVWFESADEYLFETVETRVE